MFIMFLCVRDLCAHYVFYVLVFRVFIMILLKALEITNDRAVKYKVHLLN